MGVLFRVGAKNKCPLQIESHFEVGPVHISKVSLEEVPIWHVAWWSEGIASVPNNNCSKQFPPVPAH